MPGKHNTPQAGVVLRFSMRTRLRHLASFVVVAAWLMIWVGFAVTGFTDSPWIETGNIVIASLLSTFYGVLLADSLFRRITLSDSSICVNRFRKAPCCIHRNEITLVDGDDSCIRIHGLSGNAISCPYRLSHIEELAQWLLQLPNDRVEWYISDWAFNYQIRG